MAKFTLHNPTATPPVPEVDPAALEAFAAGARERQSTEAAVPPWEQHDPNAIPRYNVSIRMNDYELEMLRYLAKVKGISQHKLLSQHVMPLLKQMAVAAFEAERAKST